MWILLPLMGSPSGIEETAGTRWRFVNLKHVKLKIVFIISNRLFCLLPTVVERFVTKRCHYSIIPCSLSYLSKFQFLPLLSSAFLNHRHHLPLPPPPPPRHQRRTPAPSGHQCRTPPPSGHQCRTPPPSHPQRRSRHHPAPSAERCHQPATSTERQPSYHQHRPPP